MTPYVSVLEEWDDMVGNDWYLKHNNFKYNITNLIGRHHLQTFLIYKIGWINKLQKNTHLKLKNF